MKTYLPGGDTTRTAAWRGDMPERKCLPKGLGMGSNSPGAIPATDQPDSDYDIQRARRTRRVEGFSKLKFFFRFTDDDDDEWESCPKARTISLIYERVLFINIIIIIVVVGIRRRRPAAVILVGLVVDTRADQGGFKRKKKSRWAGAAEVEMQTER